jgi:hypothetical protein
VLCTITFAGAFGTTPDSIQLFQANDNSAGRITLLHIDPTEISTTQFKVRVGLSGALVAATEYKLYYKIN